MKKFQSIFIIIIIIIVSILIMIFFAGRKKTPKKQSVKETTRYVKAKNVKLNTISTTLQATGRLTSFHQINITAEVQGKILPGNVLLKNGTTFKKGDILFKIFNKEAIFNHKARLSRFLNSVAILLPDISIDFPKSVTKWENFFENIKLDKPLPKLPKFNSLKEKVFLASRNILSEFFQLKSEEIRLKKYTVRAPFSGSIIAVNFQVQSIANPGAIIAVVSKTDELELEVPVNLTFLKWLKINDKVKVLFDENRNETEGKIARISNVINPKTQSFTVFIHIKNKKELPLFSGLYLTAIFNKVTFANSMEIPRNSVFNRDTVYIIKNNRLKKKKILIKKINSETIIFSGLRNDDIVVIEPLINAKENSLVQILK